MSVLVSSTNCEDTKSEAVSISLVMYVPTTHITRIEKRKTDRKPNLLSHLNLIIKTPSYYVYGAYLNDRNYFLQHT